MRIADGDKNKKYGYQNPVHKLIIWMKLSTLRLTAFRETRLNINHSNTIWRMASYPHISPITAPVWFSCMHNLAWFSDVGYSVRPIHGAAYDDAKSSWIVSLGTVRRSATPPWSNANIECRFLMCESYKTDSQKVAVMWSRFLIRHVL